MNGTTLTKAFVPLTGGDTAVYNSSGLAYFRHTDWLGSSRFASTPSQTQYSDSAYSPFGEPYASSGAIDPSFTGQNQDTTAGLYDFLFREQDPNQARWISPDPAGLAAIDPSDPQTWNRYAYTLNSPLNQVDPLGLFTLTPPGCFPIYLGPGQPAVLVCVVWPGGSDGGDGSGCRPTYFLPLDPDPLAYGDDAEADPQSGPGCGGRGGTQHSGGNSSGGGQHYYPPASRKVATGNACLASYNASALGKIVGLVSPVTLISQAKDVWMEWTLLPATKIATLSTLKSVSSAVGNSEFGSITGAGPTVTIEAPTAAGIDAFESTAANPVTWLVVPFATAFDAAMRNTCSQLPNFTLQNVP
jgi:RHS repeat-associated protein